MTTLQSVRSVGPSVRPSVLDQALAALRRDHARHAAGPILPCPLCFEPALAVGPSEPVIVGRRSLPGISTIQTDSIPQAAAA
jgi:hypothetical protein